MGERLTLTWGDYKRVFLDCPYRGRIIELQVHLSEWPDKKYDKFRR